MEDWIHTCLKEFVNDTRYSLGFCIYLQARSTMARMVVDVGTYLTAALPEAYQETQACGDFVNPEHYYTFLVHGFQSTAHRLFS